MLGFLGNEGFKGRATCRDHDNLQDVPANVVAIGVEEFFPLSLSLATSYAVRCNPTTLENPRL